MGPNRRGGKCRTAALWLAADTHLSFTFSVSHSFTFTVSEKLLSVHLIICLALLFDCNWHLAVIFDFVNPFSPTFLIVAK